MVILKHEELQRIFEEKGLKQNAFADSVGIAPSTFNRLLHGKQEASARLIKAIAFALGISETIIMDTEPDKKAG